MHAHYRAQASIYIPILRIPGLFLLKKKQQIGSISHTYQQRFIYRELNPKELQQTMNIVWRAMHVLADANNVYSNPVFLIL